MSAKVYVDLSQQEVQDIINVYEKELDKYKTTIDKIKEYCKNTINRYEDYIGKEDIVRENKFILELLEEIE